MKRSCFALKFCLVQNIQNISVPQTWIQDDLICWMAQWSFGCRACHSTVNPSASTVRSYNMKHVIARIVDVNVLRMKRATLTYTTKND